MPVGKLQSARYLHRDVELLAYRRRRLPHVITESLQRDDSNDVETALGIRAFDDLDAALAERPDGVFICTPSSQHLDIAQRAADAGCHLFIEKPVSHTLDGLDRLQATVSGRRLVALVGCLALAQLFPRNPVISLWLHHEPERRLATANAIVAMVPDGARVAASSRIAPHLLRRYLYYYPLADPTILPTIDYIIADISSNSFDDPDSGAQLQEVRTSPEWELVLDRDGYQVFRRR